MTCVILQSIATSLVMQLIIEMHIALNYTLCTIKKMHRHPDDGTAGPSSFSQKLDDGPDDGSPALTHRLARHLLFRLQICNLSLYDNFFNTGKMLVAFFSTFSSASTSPYMYGAQTEEQ